MTSIEVECNGKYYSSARGSLRSFAKGCGHCARRRRAGARAVLRWITRVQRDVGPTRSFSPSKANAACWKDRWRFSG